MKILNIYIDGSHLNKQNNGRLGIGGALVDPSVPGKLGVGTLLDKYSIELSPEFMKFEFGADKCSNPSAELTALLFALRAFSKQLINVNKVIIHADYVGVRDWMTGAWKVKEPYIAEIKNQIIQELNKQRLVGKIEYVWVKAHQKDNTKPEVYWNNLVDLLAKGQDINI